MTIPPELCSKGGPCHFEAIFVGYEEDRIGWRVWDFQGKYLAPICKIDVPASHSSDPTAVVTCPTRTLNPTSKGQAFAEAICIYDECLASC